jgi:hypothetical protein
MLRNLTTGAVLLTCGLVVGCGNQQPENSQNLEPNAPAVAAENAGVVEIEPAVEPTRSAPAPSPRRNESAVTGTSSRFSPAPDKDRASARRAEASAPAPAAPRWRDVTVPAGTALPLELLTAVSSESAQVETPVRARLRQAVVVDDFTALPAGTILHGNVTDVDRAGRVRGRSRLAFRFTEAELDGGREELRTNPVSFEGEATKGEDATKVGAGAVGGAIIGGILGGGDGAAKGAAIGGAAGTGVVLATRGREVSLAAGADIAATLASAFTVRAPAR